MTDTALLLLLYALLPPAARPLWRVVARRLLARGHIIRRLLTTEAHHV